MRLHQGSGTNPPLLCGVVVSQSYLCRVLGADDSMVEEFLIVARDHMAAAAKAVQDNRIRNGAFGFEILADARRLVYVPHPKR